MWTDVTYNMCGIFLFLFFFVFFFLCLVLTVLFIFLFSPPRQLFHSGSLELYAQLCTGSVVEPAQCTMEAEYAVAVRAMVSPRAKADQDASVASIAVRTDDGEDDNAVTTNTNDDHDDRHNNSSSSHHHHHHHHNNNNNDDDYDNNNNNNDDDDDDDNNNNPDDASRSCPDEPVASSTAAEADATTQAAVLAYDYNSLTVAYESTPWMAFLLEVLFVGPNFAGWFIGEPNLLAWFRGACVHQAVAGAAV